MPLKEAVSNGGLTKYRCGYLQAGVEVPNINLC